MLSGISVLVVDDDDENREVVAAHLENERACVFTAASAAQAFDFLHRQRVDVLLADIAMPGEDGYALIRRLRASSALETASIPAVALTALAREQDRQQALRSGFQLHLAKPVDARALVAAVASLGRAHTASHWLQRLPRRDYKARRSSTTLEGGGRPRCPELRNQPGIRGSFGTLLSLSSPC